MCSCNLAVKREFSEAIGKSHSLDSFGGIFIDKVHNVFVSRDFQACIWSLWGIHTLPFPIVVMSGTLPVMIERLLIAELNLQASAVIVHGSSNCPELRYIIEPPPTLQKALYKHVQMIVRLHSLGEKEKGLIFVNTVILAMTLFNMSTVIQEMGRVCGRV